MKFGTVPDEPAKDDSLSDCAPQFAAAVPRVIQRMTDAGYDAVIYETVRTAERQAWLYGFGRDYDDGRGIVTNAQTAENGWHYFGCAADVISASKEWDAPQEFWDALRDAAEAEGLTSGSRWRVVDKPHIQWGKCKPAPSDEARALYANGGVEAVWSAVGAT